ncbi:MAG TPA: hypothetical protein VMX15_00050 [Candidatus Heimdallarchaeota archaeon]|nr:hypothetical protein [Candidatus Heimdallarchaeota archaeon]
MSNNGYKLRGALAPRSLLLSPTLWEHWPHLLQKPVISLAIWAVLHFFLSPVLAVSLAIAVPALISFIRKQVLWPGSWRTVEVYKDEFIDAWASAIGVVSISMPQYWGVVTAAIGIIVLLGLHKWALP